MPLNSPFKFLDAYNKGDKDIFFGRDEEVDQLYQLVFQSNLTLVYGQSGTGKTSLVQCGLANRFAASDWFNVYIRRGNNINQELKAALKHHDIATPESGILRQRLRKRFSAVKDQKDSGVSEVSINPIIQILRRVYKRYLKPIYLIFDQFEELFILGTQEEQRQFYQTIAEILETEIYCRVLIIMREESIAQLYDFEKVVPILFEKRLRVEPMSRAKTTEVITGTCKQFEIELAGDHVPGEIIDVVSTGQGRVELTHLQVFLDRLFQLSKTPEADKRRVFDSALIKAGGSMEEVLANFLENQTDTIQKDILKQYPSLPPTAVRKLLHGFITLEGTKRPYLREEIKMSRLPEEALDQMLQRLESARIIRYENNRYELAHDMLARQIANQRSEQEIALVQVVKLVHDRIKAYQTTKSGFNNNELAVIKTYRTKLEEEESLSLEEWAFVDRNIRSNFRKRLALIVVIIAVISFLSISTVYALQQKSKAEKNEQVALDNEQLANNRLQELQKEQRRRDSLMYFQRLDRGKAFMAEKNYLAAIPELNTALEIDSTGLEADSLLQLAISLSDVGSEFQALIEQGDALFNRGPAFYVDARNAYQKAKNLGYNDTEAQVGLNKVEGQLGAAFNEFMRKGKVFLRGSNAKELAEEQFRQALRIKPFDSEANSLLRQAQRK